MAKFGAILGNLSGSTGANTFSHNRGGPYLRRRSVPTNPQSSAQTGVRTTLSELSAAWQGLTSDQRDGWIAWANSHPGTDSLGNAINFTGHQLYIGTNARLLGAGAARVDDAPTTPGPDNAGPVTVTAIDANSVSVDDWTYTTANGWLQVWWSRPFTGARNPSFKAARIVGYIEADAAQPATLALPSSFPTGTDARFFVSAVGPDGQVSQPVSSTIEGA